VRRPKAAVARFDEMATSRWPWSARTGRRKGVDRNPVPRCVPAARIRITRSQRTKADSHWKTWIPVCNLTGTYPSGYIQRVDAVLHALSDESRRTVLDVLRDHPATVNELASLLPIARPGVSRHLRVLREAGLVEVDKQAQWRVYRLRPAPLTELDAWLGHYRTLWETRLDALHTEVARGKEEQRSTT